MEYSPTGNLRDLVRVGIGYAAFFGFFGDAFGDGVVGKGFRRRREAKNFVFDVFAVKLDFGNPELAGGEGSGLVKNCVFDFGKALAVFGALDYDAAAGGGADARKIRQRNGKNQRAGAA